MKRSRPLGLPVEVVLVIATVLACVAIVWLRVAS